MAMYSGDRQAGEDDESLTEMMTERTTTKQLPPNDATYQRNQFWTLRYEVQKIQSLRDEEAQRMISSRLTTLHRLARFNVDAIRKTKVCKVLKQLLKKSCPLGQDKRRLRKRSQHLLRRLNGTIYAHQRRGTRNTARIEDLVVLWTPECEEQLLANNGPGGLGT